MILFKKKHENVYLVTNYKVMYSTLTSHDNLEMLDVKKVYIKALLSWFSNRSKFYLIVRNPYNRIQSFYKSKFLKAEKNRLWMIENEEGEWQQCTEHFFPYLGLNNNMDSKKISKKLMETSFEEVVSILPSVYMKDGHMWPQHLSRKFTINKFGLQINIPIKYKKIYKLEVKEDLNELEKIFDLNLSYKRNNTEDIKQLITWNSNTKKTIENLYKKDFQYFSYGN